MPERIAIIGASGFVGSALTEYLLDRTGYSVTAFCHSTGGATRLVHRDIAIRQMDLLDRNQLETAISEFDFVVNCSRGGKQLMEDGLDNLLGACRKARVKKFVHLSSVAVYGDPPHPQSTTEDAPTEAAPNSYGAVKLEQDKRVQRASGRGLNAVILCPPNIIGPYSEYLLDIINSIEAGRFQLIEEGLRSINIVDVNNLSACILSALTSDVSDARRLFVCEPAGITWQQLCLELKPVIRGNPNIPCISVDEFDPGTVEQSPGRRKPGGAIKHLASDEVRSALRLHPVWAFLENRVKSGIRLFGKGAEEYIRETLQGPIQIPVTRMDEALDRALIAQQLRGVKHDPSRCQRELGFSPYLSFAESMQSFRDWYIQYFQFGSPEWELLGDAVK